MTLFSIAISLFFILNSLGNLPVFVGLLSSYPPRKQRKIILRELLIALGILVFFAFFGVDFLDLIGIDHCVIGIAGGTLLFLISLSMIFPKKKDLHSGDRDPFVFPLAIPMIAGPGSLTTVMIYAQQNHNPFVIVTALVLAWVPTTIILLASSHIKRFLGQKGLRACERLGGMLICLVAVQMFTTGVVQLIKNTLLLAGK